MESRRALLALVDLAGEERIKGHDKVEDAHKREQLRAERNTIVLDYVCTAKKI